MRTLIMVVAVAALLTLGLAFRSHDSLPAGRASHDRLDGTIGRVIRQQRRMEEKLLELSERLERVKNATKHALEQPAANADGSVAALKKKAHKKVLAAANCPNRHPFHTLMTAQSSIYQQWQSRIAYFHWKKQAAAGGECTDMVSSSRLPSTAPPRLSTHAVMGVQPEAQSEVISSNQQPSTAEQARRSGRLPAGRLLPARRERGRRARRSRERDPIDLHEAALAGKSL